MTNVYSTEADFEAEITILTSEEGGRMAPPYNFIRWDFGYAEDNPTEPKRNMTAPIYMIYPNFLDNNGLSIPTGIPLEGVLKARMHILIKEMVEYHRKRITVGVKFNCHEGSKIVARGIVTKLLAISV